jgi:hypothetical protein
MYGANGERLESAQKMAKKWLVCDGARGVYSDREEVGKLSGKFVPYSTSAVIRALCHLSMDLIVREP